MSDSLAAQIEQALEAKDWAAAARLLGEARKIPGPERPAAVLALERRAFKLHGLELEKAWCWRTLEGHTGAVVAVAFAGDEQVLSAGRDGTVRHWRLDEPHAPGRVAARTTVPLTSLAVAEQTRAAVAAAAGPILLLADQAESRRDWWMAVQPAAATVFDVVARARLALGRPNAAPEDRCLVAWGAAGEEVGRSPALPARVAGARWQLSRDLSGTLQPVAYAVCADGSLQGWRPLDGHVFEAQRGFCRTPVALAGSPDTRRVYGGGADGRVAGFLLLGAHPGPMEVAPTGLALRSLVVTGGGTVALVGTAAGELVAADYPSGRHLLAVRAHEGPVLGLAVSPDGCVAASAGADGLVRLWWLEWSLNPWPRN